MTPEHQNNCLYYLYLASVGRIPLGTGSIGPVFVSTVAFNNCFGSGSDGRPAASDGACNCSIDKKQINKHLG